MQISRQRHFDVADADRGDDSARSHNDIQYRRARQQHQSNNLSRLIRHSDSGRQTHATGAQLGTGSEEISQFVPATEHASTQSLPWPTIHPASRPPKQLSARLTRQGTLTPRQSCIFKNIRARLQLLSHLAAIRELRPRISSRPWPRWCQLRDIHVLELAIWVDEAMDNKYRGSLPGRLLIHTARASSKLDNSKRPPEPDSNRLASSK